MKRSEMIDTIAFELERLGANDEIVDIWAASILFKIEKAGMLPPTESTWHSPVSYIWDKEDK